VTQARAPSRPEFYNRPLGRAIPAAQVRHIASHGIALLLVQEHKLR